MATQRILVVDDEESLGEILKFNLEVDGYEVTTALSAEEAMRLDLSQFHLMLLDVMMGEMSGFQLARKIKSDPTTASIPIIFCTALDSEDDIVKGLNIGADDYISKPFSLREVLARVRSVLRRTASSTPSVERELVFEGLRLDFHSKSCTVHGKAVSLTKKEFEILHFLIEKRGTILSREEILQHVWPDEVIVLDRTVDVNITRLRKKIEPYGQHIITRLGFGYGFLA